MRRTIDSSERSPTNGSQDITTISHTINYFNHNFCENSDSSRQGIASTGTKSKSTNDNFQAGDDCKKAYHQLRRPLKKSFGMQLLEKDGTDDMFPEKTLAEIGFNSTKVSNWDKIVQPHKTDMLVLLEKMIKNYEKTNVQIRIADTTFNCHMMVLQCYSDFFMELNSEQLVVLPADKVTPEAFFMVYDWMLSSKPMVQREGMLELFNAAQFLKIKGLVDQCWVCLDDDEHFCEDAAFLLYLEARKYDHELIQQLMLSRICKFFLTLVASKEFLELTPKEVCTLLQSNTIGVNMETEVLMAAVRWLNHNWEEREKYLLDLIGCVRFGLMTPWQLVELRKNTDSPEIQKVVNCTDVQKMIDDGLSYVTTKYWYASNSENLFHLMERLNLTEPVERQWIKDKTWSENFECPNQMYSCYRSFLEYLDMIRKLGTQHWKTLECYEGSPNLVFQGYNFQSTNYDDHQKLEDNISAVYRHIEKH